MLSSTIPVAGIVIALCRSRCIGVGDCADSEPAGGSLQPGAHRAAVPAGARRRGADRDRARRRAQPARRCSTCRSSGWSSSPPGSGVPDQVPSTQALTLVGSGLTGIGLGATVAPALFCRGLLAARREPAARVRDRRAAARGRGIHDRARVRPLRRLPSAATSTNGTRIALWIGLGLALGGAGDRGRDLPARRGAPANAATGAFMAGQGPAWYSPPLLGPSATNARSTRRSPRSRHHRDDAPSGSGPVVFAYDGSDLAKLAIEEAGRQLVAGRDARRQPCGSRSTSGSFRRAGCEFDAAQIGEVRAAAEQTAADGASLAKTAGFRAESAASKARRRGRR